MSTVNMGQQGFWDDAVVISSYSRRQAIEDGVLVCLSGPDYSAEGDQWIPDMVSEVGIRIPVAMTVEAFSLCVAMSPAAKRACNDIQGRLWDVLYMLRRAIGRCGGGNELLFELRCVTASVRPSRVVLKSHVGPGDDGEPVMTIMLPGQS